MTVAERFTAASVRPPLSDLSPAARDELGALLARADGFEDLPGKWQAALLEAEAPATRAADRGERSCCCASRAAG